MPVYPLVLAIHLLTMAAWMGGAVHTSADVERSLNAGGAAVEGLMHRLRRTAGWMNRAALGTILSGLGLIALRGVDGVAPRYWVGLLFTLLAVGVGRWQIRPVVARIASVAQRPTPRPPPDAAALAASFRHALRSEDLLKLAAFATMVWPFG